MRREYFFVLSCLAVLLSVSVSCEESGGAFNEGANGPKIFGGVQTDGYPSVGYLTSGNTACTATLISKRAALTAAHCIDSSSGRLWLGDAKYKWSQAHVHTSPSIHDVAVVILDDEVTSVTPSPINTSKVSKGDEITLVGYGYTSNSGGNSEGEKYVGDNSISRVTANELRYRGDATICNGDSGGPSFIGDKVAGVHSWGTGSGYCTEGVGADKRVDYYADWIIDKAQLETIDGDNENDDEVDDDGDDGGNDNGFDCTDNPDYVDAQGYSCLDWIGYECDRATDWGYTAQEESEIKSNCARACKLCSGISDACPGDPNKTYPGQCGCGVPDTDGDGDGTVDCLDGCPEDAEKKEPGLCGCGQAEGTCDECRDTPNYIDAQGYDCADWRHYKCSRAQERWGYTQDEEDDILANCAESCGLC